MTVLFEMHLRTGGDPRHLAEFKALHAELAKLEHPACPDVDWERVEQLCAALFEKNGADLQSLVVFVLARGQRQGLDGIVQGLAVLEALLAQWPRLWPTEDRARLDSLDWLYRRLLMLLRGFAMPPSAMPAVLRLQVQLESTQSLLQRHLASPLDSLWALHRFMAGMLLQMERGRSPTLGLPALTATNDAGLVMPVVIMPPPPLPPLFLPRAQRRRTRFGLWGGLVLVAALLSWAGWSHWQEDRQRVAALPEAVSLDSLTLFDAGRAELRTDSTQALVDALLNIKAQPGWLIVVTGHADNTGDSLRNSQLARERAMVVRDWLQRMGNIPGDCFAIRDAADRQPVADNDSEAGRAANRRVDIRLVSEPGACSVGPGK